MQDCCRGPSASECICRGIYKKEKPVSLQQETEIRALRKQADSFNQEIGRLLRRIRELETQLAQVRAERKSLG